MATKTNKKANVPNLRFPEFEEEWREVRFSEIGEFFKGAGISKEQLSEDGNPCILYGELYTRYNQEVIKTIVSKTNIDTKGLVKSKANDVIIPSSGESAKDIATACCVNLNDVLLGGDLNVIRPYRDNGNFISYQLNGKRKFDIAKIAQGSSVIHLYNNSLKSLELCLPDNIEEQNKITVLLSAIDTRIETQNKIIEEVKSLNYSLREKIFSRKVRFKNVNGRDYPDWKAMTLGDLGDVKMCRRVFNEETTSVGEVPFFKIGSFGNKADAYISRELYEDYKKRFSFPKKGDVLISAAGTIGRTIVYQGEDGYFQDSNIVWIDNDSTKVSNDFLFHVLQIVKYNTEGGTIQRLYNNILKSTKFATPNFSEQKKIANILSHLAKKTEIEKRILKGYVKQKEYLLHKLFI